MPRPSHVLLAMGVDELEARGALRFSLGHTSVAADVAALLAVLPGRRRPGAGRRAGGGVLMRVLAALSGGVDSAVAAARAVDAGHDVVGVHMALSRTRDQFRTGSRGCCSIEDAGDARRAADVLGIPYYVWDLSEKFEDTVVADFVAEYEAGRTPNPCVRCNEHIKFATLLDKAVALGFDAVATGHYARIVVRRRRDRASCTASVDPAKDQSYVLAVMGPERLARSLFPLGRRRLQGGDPRARPPRAGCRSPPSPTPTTSASSPTGTPRASCARGSGRSRARSSTSPARCSARTTARTRTRSGSGAGCRSGGPLPTASRGTCSRSSR